VMVSLPTVATTAPVLAADADVVEEEEVLDPHARAASKGTQNSRDLRGFIA
jgi:hypothetical protein